MDSPCTSSEDRQRWAELILEEADWPCLQAAIEVFENLNCSLEVATAQWHEFLEMLLAGCEEPGGDSFSPDTSEPYPF